MGSARVHRGDRHGEPRARRATGPSRHQTDRGPTPALAQTDRGTTPALAQDVTVLPQRDTVAPPARPQRPAQLRRLAAPSPPDRPREAEMHAHTQARSPRNKFIVRVGSYCWQRPAVAREHSPRPQAGSPSMPRWERAWPGRQGWCAKRRLEGVPCSEAAPHPRPAAPHLPSTSWSPQVCRVWVGLDPRGRNVHPHTPWCPQQGGRAPGWAAWSQDTGHLPE